MNKQLNINYNNKLNNEKELFENLLAICKYVYCIFLQC